MKARQLEQWLVNLSPRSASDLAIRSQKLRDARMLPVGGRGPHAPNIDARDAATMILAAACARNAVDAADAVQAFSKLKAVGGLSKSFAICESLGEAIEAILEKPSLAYAVQYVEFALQQKISLGWPYDLHRAKIVWQGSAGLEAAFYISPATAKKMKPSKIEDIGGASIEDVTRIGGGFFHQISLELSKSDDDDAEWKV